MATWTGTGSQVSSYTGTLTVTEVATDVDKNTSTVEWSLKLEGTNGYWFKNWYTDISVKINGVEVAPSSSLKIAMLPDYDTNYHSYTFWSGKRITIKHNLDGKKTIACSASIKTLTSPSYLPGTITIAGGNLTLTALHVPDPPVIFTGSPLDHPYVLDTNDLENGKIKYQLLDTEDCTVTRDVYGTYEASITILINNDPFSKVADPDEMYPGGTNVIGANNLIACPVGPDGNSQIFRVYRDNRKGDFRQEILARHISYDMTKIPVLPFKVTGVTASQLMAAVQNNAAVANDFILSSTFNPSLTFDFELTEPANMRSVLLDGSNSILQVLKSVVTGGDRNVYIEFDNFNVTLKGASASSASAVRFIPGVNMNDYSRDEDVTDVYTTGVLPYWHKNVSGTDTFKTISGDPVVYKSGSSAPRFPSVEILDVSDQFDGVPSDADLTDIAHTYMDDQSLLSFGKQPIIYSAKLEPIDELDGNLNLMQIVGIQDPAAYSDKDGIDDTNWTNYGYYSGFVTKIVYNVNGRRISSIEASNFTGTRKTIGEIISDQKRKTSELEDEVKHLKNGTSGGGGSGTTDYTRLSNKPQINGNTLIGNKSGGALGLMPIINATTGADANTLYDPQFIGLRAASHLPSGYTYGSLIVTTYRGLSGKTKPDLCAQIFLPTGDSSAGPNKMFFRTGTVDGWNNWVEVNSFSGDYNDLINLPTLFSGSWDDLTDKPTIPSELSDLSGDVNHRTVTDIQILNWNNKADIEDIPTNISSFTNDSHYFAPGAFLGVLYRNSLLSVDEDGYGSYLAKGELYTDIYNNWQGKRILEAYTTASSSHPVAMTDLTLQFLSGNPNDGDIVIVHFLNDYPDPTSPTFTMSYNTGSGTYAGQVLREKVPDIGMMQFLQGNEVIGGRPYPFIYHEWIYAPDPEPGTSGTGQTTSELHYDWTLIGPSEPENGSDEPSGSKHWTGRATRAIGTTVNVSILESGKTMLDVTEGDTLTVAFDASPTSSPFYFSKPTSTDLRAKAPVYSNYSTETSLNYSEIPQGTVANFLYLDGAFTICK